MPREKHDQLHEPCVLKIKTNQLPRSLITYDFQIREKNYSQCSQKKKCNEYLQHPYSKYKKVFYRIISYRFFVISRPMARQNRSNVPYICIIYLEIDSLKWLPKTAQIQLKRHQPSGMPVPKETHCTWLIQTNILMATL